jgi:hypothetical protein
MQQLLIEIVKHRTEVLSWLSNTDFRSNYLDALQLREAGTGQWLIDQELFKSWKYGPVQTLWLHGMRTYLFLFSKQRFTVEHRIRDIADNHSWSR